MNVKQEILDNLSFNVEAFSNRFEFVVSELRKYCDFHKPVNDNTLQPALIAAGCDARTGREIHKFIIDYSALLEAMKGCGMGLFRLFRLDF